MSIDKAQGSSDSLRAHPTARNQTDRELLVRTAEGSEEAFDSLYRRYGTSIYNYILRLIHEKTVAEELTQEVFLAVWKNATTYANRASVKTWMFSIAHNQAISWLRKLQPMELLDDNKNRSSPERILENAMIVGVQLDQLKLALDQLPFNQRATIELSFIHGLNYREISKIMDCPIGTVKSRTAYALRQLNRLLSVAGDEEQPSS